MEKIYSKSEGVVVSSEAVRFSENKFKQRKRSRFLQKKMLRSLKEILEIEH